MSKASVHHQAVTDCWAEVATGQGLHHQVLAPPPADGRLARIRQRMSGAAQGPRVDGNRISRLLTGMIDGVQVAVVAGTEVRSSSVDNDTDAQTVTCYVADAPWLPDGVRAGARSTKGAAKHAAGGTVGWSWLDLASRDDSGLVVRARDEQAAEAWLTDRRIQALSSATTVDRALRLVDGAVEIRSKGIESDPATMAMALRAVTGLALALR